MNSDNIAFLKDTLTCIERGYYFYKNVKTELSLSRNKTKDALVFLPEDIVGLRMLGGETAEKKLKCSVKSADAFTAAMELAAEPYEKPVLVLNFANAVHPGGGVRRGSRAQEEDLCRTSTLLDSLESSEADKYYSYNKSLNSFLGSDAVIISPHVEVFRDRHGNYLEKSFEVSVLTCAAPDMRRNGELDKDEYNAIFSCRIESIFLTAAYLGYKKLILGAWGCGAFANDPRLVSDMFYKTVTRFSLFGNTPCSLFDEIVFAVPYGRADHSNYYEFTRNFCDFRICNEKGTSKSESAAEKVEAKNNSKLLNRIKGCLVGGAAGDALGYPVEFLTNSGIKGKYGKNGICSYTLEKGKALISDDTQMLLFTAQGLLEKHGSPEINIAKAYLDWHKTQTCAFEEIDENDKKGLLACEELYSLRAPGNACLSSLEKRSIRLPDNPDFISEPVNMSKGCGGIMRAAPCAFYEMPNCQPALKRIAMLAAQSSAVTHGHPLGYMSSSVLALIIAKCLVPGDESLKDIILDSLRITDELFYGEKYLEALNEAVLSAVKLSENNKDDAVNLRKLGEGWVAEETLAVAVYCALKYSNDFSAAIIAAVNHSGDSDSTGAVTGNILGAFLGFDAIESKWKEKLELYDTICGIAVKCAERLEGEQYGREPEQIVETLAKSCKIVFFAGSLMECDRILEIASALPSGAETVICLASPEHHTADELLKSGVNPKYSFTPAYTSGSDYAADLIPLFTGVLKTEKPDAAVCVSSAECGFAAAISASGLGITAIAVSAGIRPDESSRQTLMRSACDSSALWRAAANENALTVLLDEGFEKGSIISCDAEANTIAEKLMEIIKKC